MIKRTFVLSAPPDFNFWRTVLSHGWCTLQPFFLDRSNRLLLRVLELSSQPALLEMKEKKNGAVHVQVSSPQVLTDEDLKAAKAAAAHILRLRDSLADFYRELARNDARGRFAWVPKVKAGAVAARPILLRRHG